MKRINMFQRLPKEDRTLVLDLCAKLPYEIAAEQLAKPRSEGGLSLTTSASSLCRFFTAYEPESINTAALGQFAQSLRINYQAHGEANFEALLVLVQNRLLAALRGGRAVADLEKEFRTLTRVQKCFVTDSKFRADNPERLSDAYLEHVKNMTVAPDADFIRNDVPADPGASKFLAADFHEEQSQFERDFEYALALPNDEVGPRPTFMRDCVRDLVAMSAKRRNENYLLRHQLNAIRNQQSSGTSPVEQLSAILSQVKAMSAGSDAGTAESAGLNEISRNQPSKTPAISRISPNFTSAENHRNDPSHSLSSEEPQHGNKTP
jgi:hypothetical protein